MKTAITSLAFCALFLASASADEKSYQEAALKVIAISNSSITKERLAMLARTTQPDLRPEDAMAEAERTIKIMQSAAFRKKHAAIYMKYFSEAELTRLAVLLGDPVLKKFNEKRAVYTAEFMRLLIHAIEESIPAEQDGAGQPATRSESK